MNIDWPKVSRKIGTIQPTLIPAAQFVYRNELESQFPANTIYMCDAYVKDIEIGDKVDGGYQVGRCINIDHHAPTPEMSRIISSTPLAIERVNAHGVADQHDNVVINHTDCDSVLSAAIMLGILPPEQELGQAAIAADHTGQPNEIADLLQPCARLHDFNFSLRNLVKQQTGQKLDAKADELYQEQVTRRQQAKTMVESGKFEILPHGVVWAITESRIDGALLPSLLPEAKAIVIATKLKDTGKWRIATRLGQSAPSGMTLHTLNIRTQIDPAFGGRWNAGNTTRTGGSNLHPSDYAKRLDQQIGQHLAEMHG